MRYISILCILSLALLATGFAGGQRGNTPVPFAGASDQQIVRPPVDVDVLYDQSTDPTDNSITAQNFEALYDIYDAEAGDDFVIPSGETWNINQVTILGQYFTGSPGPVASVNVWFYTDVATFPGTVIESRLAVVPTSDVAGDLVVDFADVTLGTGTYWMVVQANMDFGIGGQWGWDNATVLHNSASVWQNPGGGFLAGCTTWGRTLDDCIGFGPDFAFILCGTMGGGGGLQCSDLTSFIAKCHRLSGAVLARVRMSGVWTGETVTFDLDGDDYIVPVRSNGTNSQAELMVPAAGMGSHTVTLEDPAGCYSPIMIVCQIDAPPDPEWDALWAEYEVLEAQALKAIPTETRIIGNYPNPFNPSTTIRYALSVDSPVSVRVYNMLGQEVATLVDGFQKAGEQSVVWHGVNNFGQSVASGLYVYRLQTDNSVMTQKMLFTK